MNLTDGRKPSLYDARQRIARSEEHLDNLRTAISDCLRTNDFPISETESFDFEPPPIIPILIGELTYNLKAALDYLVFQLFYLDTGKGSSATKFVIEPSPEAWNKLLIADAPKQQKRLWLPKLAPAHQAMLKSLQPFMGTEWPAILQRITNRDKHRFLALTVGAITSAKIDQLSAERAAAIPSAFPLEMFMNFEIAATVTFKECGMPVVETLEVLEEQVTNVIEAFEPDFA